MTMVPFFVLLFLLSSADAFQSLSPARSIRSSSLYSNKPFTVQLQAELDDEKVTQLFAWLSRTFAGDRRYDNLMLAFAAIFGNLPQDSVPVIMVETAMASLPPEEFPCGTPYGQFDREQASLGAMGAAQWTGKWKTRPHALLDVTQFSSVDEWHQSLPRGCKRTLQKAAQQNFTVTAKPIYPDKPAPHSSLAHFRCVVDHELRLLSYSSESFFDALAEAVSRYVGTTRMTGEIHEYRLDGKVIAFAHEVRKGSTIRGQWFYGNDISSQKYVWFHSVRDLVKRAIDAEGVSVVDLGPSGSDAFSELKQRYGFISVDDWPAVANYIGPFWRYDGVGKGRNSPIDWESMM